MTHHLDSQTDGIFRKLQSTSPGGSKAANKLTTMRLYISQSEDHTTQDTRVNFVLYYSCS